MVKIYLSYISYFLDIFISSVVESLSDHLSLLSRSRYLYLDVKGCIESSTSTKYKIKL